jgi:RNA polymerase sigma-70 factor (ECF subfamily)
MPPHPSTPIEDREASIQGGATNRAIEDLYDNSGARNYAITPAAFHQIIAAVLLRYAANSSEPETAQLLESLRVEELILARACSAGNDSAWSEFIARFRAPLYATAFRLTHNDTSARELADGLNAELYGIPNREGRRISRLDYYMGRGSLEGWLRTVLARQHIDRCRAQSKEVSLEEQVEQGVSFAARPQTETPEADARVPAAIAQTLAELGNDDRFLLASYFLDHRTLADIGRQTGVHESTISRKLDKLTATLRKRVKNRLQAAGIESRRCNELLQELDVRDIDVNVTANLEQANLKQANL